MSEFRPLGSFGEGLSDGPAPAEPLAAPDLAAQLAARICHDLINPASAVVSGLDLLEDPSAQDMRDDAMRLIEASARKLVAQLAFARVAFGASAAAQTFGSEDLNKLAQGVFADLRPTLDWQVRVPTMNKPAARAALNLAQMGGTALPTGGTARILAVESGSDLLLALEAEGARARLRPEVAAGLRGERSSEGGPGYWVQAYYLHALLKSVGGRVDAAATDGRVVIRVRTPLD
jgi:histidine phosphotransferase ChpT